MAWTADERKKFGIPPKGDGPHAPSSYGFPLPPKDHPNAKKAARAVLSRAHQSKNFDPADVAKQVAKARAILGEPAKESGRGSESLGVFALREVSASDDAGNAKVIIIREGPGNLGDRHWYPAQTLIDSVNAGVWEGAQAYFDHPTSLEERDIPERSVKNLAGWFSDAKIVDYSDPERGACKAIEATFHPQLGESRTSSLLRTCVEYAKAFPTKSYVGLSINACGNGEQAMFDGETWNRVDSITEVVSVDFVTRAGAGGKPIAFRESYKVAKTLKNVDPLAIKEAHVADGRAAVRKFLEGAAISLTPEQDQALDAALGIVDGGKLDQVLDAATSVSPADDQDDDDDEEGDDMTEAERKAKEAKDKEAKDKEGAFPGDHGGPGAGDPETTGDEMEESDEMTEADLAPFKGKTPEQLMDIAARLHKKVNKPDAPVEQEETAEPAMAEEVKEANRRAATAERALKEVRVKAVLESQNVPKSHRPRITRELMESRSVTTEPQIAARVTEYVQAFVTSQDGAGQTFRENRSGSTELKMTFTAPRAYAD